MSIYWIALYVVLAVFGLFVWLCDCRFRQIEDAINKLIEAQNEKDGDA